MRILVISEHFFPVQGGSTNYVYNLCKSLRGLGCEVFLVTLPDNKNPTLTWHIENGIEIFRLKIPRLLRKERYFPYFLSHEIDRIIDDVDPDITHFAYGFFAPLVTRVKRRITYKPVVWTVHNVPPYEHALQLNLKIANRVLEKIYLASADIYGRIVLKIVNFSRLICISEKTAELVKGRGVNPDKIVTIPVGVNIHPHPIHPHHKKSLVSLRREKNIQDRYPVVTTVAGIWPNKGLEYLISAAVLVLKKYPNALFNIIGPVRSEEYHNKLRSMIQKLGITGSVRLVGRESREKLLDYYAASDLYIQPSLEEAFCISILEAMAMGKPVIGSRTGAIPKFIEESKGGILVDPGSSEQIYRAVIELLQDPEKMDQAGKHAREYVLKNYSWEKIAEETLKLYNDVIKEG